MDRDACGQPAATARRRLTLVGLSATALIGAAVSAVMSGGENTNEAPASEAGTSSVAGVPVAVLVPAVTAERGDGRQRSADHPLQRELLTMPDPERRSVLRLAIQERALECADVTDASPLLDGVAVWRVACSGAHAYIVDVDGLGRIGVEAQFYHQPSVVPPRSPADSGRDMPPGIEPRRFDRGPFDRFR